MIILLLFAISSSHLLTILLSNLVLVKITRIKWICSRIIFIIQARGIIRPSILTVSYLHPIRHPVPVRVRIERIKQFLSSSKLPLAKISELTGFNCVESMCKLFKQKTGVAPGRFRKTWTD